MAYLRLFDALKPHDTHKRHAFGGGFYHTKIQIRRHLHQVQKCTIAPTIT